MISNYGFYLGRQSIDRIDTVPGFIVGRETTPASGVEQGEVVAISNRSTLRTDRLEKADGCSEGDATERRLTPPPGSR